MWEDPFPYPCNWRCCCRYCQDSKAPYAKTPVPGCSLWFNGTFYDNVALRRRGATSLSWPKPKIKVESGKQGMVRHSRRAWVGREAGRGQECFFENVLIDQ